MSNPIAVFDTSAGSFKAELYLDKMPITAGNFIKLAEDGFYNGLHFHRVIKDFMVSIEYDRLFTYLVVVNFYVAILKV